MRLCKNLAAPIHGAYLDLGPSEEQSAEFDRLLSEMGQSIGWMLRVYGELLGQIRRLSD